MRSEATLFDVVRASFVVEHGLQAQELQKLWLLDQGSNPCPLHCKVDSLPPSHQGSPQLYFCNYFLQVCACHSTFVTNALDDFHTLGVCEPLLNDQQCKFKQQQAMLAHLTGKNKKEGPRVSLVMGSQGDIPDTLRWRGKWGEILGGRFC